PLIAYTSLFRSECARAGQAATRHCNRTCVTHLHSVAAAPSASNAPPTIGQGQSAPPFWPVSRLICRFFRGERYLPASRRTVTATASRATCPRRFDACASRVSRRSEAVVAVADAAQAAEHRAFAAALATGLRRRRQHASGQARERQRLQPYLAGAGERGQENTLAAEQHALDATDRTHVHLHAGVVADHAAGIDIDAFAGGKLALHHATAGMDEHPAVAFQLLHDEALAAEQAGEDPPLEVDADLHAARAGQEAVLLADDLAAVFVQLHRQHRARVRRGEGDLGLAAAGVGEHRGEQALAGDHALSGRQQLVHEAAALALV